MGHQVTGGAVPLDRGVRDQQALIREITIRLAFELAHRPGDARPW